MQFWMINDDNAKAVIITDKPYRNQMWNEFRPGLQSANEDMVHEPLIAILEEIQRQLSQPLMRGGFYKAAGHVGEAIKALRESEAAIRSA